MGCLANEPESGSCLVGAEPGEEGAHWPQEELRALRAPALLGEPGNDERPGERRKEWKQRHATERATAPRKLTRWRTKHTMSHASAGAPRRALDLARDRPTYQRLPTGRRQARRLRPLPVVARCPPRRIAADSARPAPVLASAPCLLHHI